MYHWNIISKTWTVNDKLMEQFKWIGAASDWRSLIIIGRKNIATTKAALAKLCREAHVLRAEILWIALFFLCQASWKRIWNECVYKWWIDMGIFFGVGAAAVVAILFKLRIPLTDPHIFWVKWTICMKQMGYN